MSLSRNSVVAYSLPAIAMAMPVLPVYVLLPTFYAENTSLSLVTIGGILFFARLFDVASDALAGRLCDYSPLGLGRRRGWMLIGGLLLCPSLIALFAPPEDAGAGWLFISAVTLYLGWTWVQVPYLAWVADLTPHYDERTKLNSHREAIGLIGLVLSAAWPALGGYLEIGERAQYLWLACTTVAVGLITFSYLFVTLPEPPKVRSPHTRWQAMFRNRVWLRLVISWCVNGIANGLPAILFPLFITEVLGEPASERGLYLLIYFIAAVAAMPVILLLSKRIDKHRLWCYSLAFSVVIFATVPLLGEGDGAWFVLVCVLTGAALGADLTLPPAMLADVVDWDRYRYQRESSAMCFAGGSLAIKLALGIAVALGPLLLTLFGWQDDGEQQAPLAVFGVAVIYAWLPCVLKIIVIGIIWRYPLTRNGQRAIRRKLDHYEQRGSSRTTDNAVPVISA